MDIKNKKILITGGLGFIGSYVAKKLLVDGAVITIFDNFSTGRIENLETIKKDIKIVKGDILDARKLEKEVKGQDIIIHEAFPYGESTREVDKQFIEDGATGTFNVLRAALQNNIQKVVYASSVAVYGIQQYIPIDEDHPKAPFLPYGATKYVGELYCSAFSNVYGLDTVSLRYFNVFGPRYATFDHSAMINFLMRATKNQDLIIYGDGEQIRDYTYIDDAVDGTIAAVIKETSSGEVYNIGSGNGIGISNLAKKIIAFTDTKSVIRSARKDEYRYITKGLPYGITDESEEGFLDVRDYVADISKAKLRLSYRPKVSIDDGIKKTFQWIKNVELR